ncbi:hypothetical protein H5410_045902, partial [Solanum commersonii]
MENTIPIYGREIENFINLVLDALPIYMMSLFPIPTRAIKSLDKMRMKFLWQGYNEKKRFRLVEWEFVATGEKNGGLRIKIMKFLSKEVVRAKFWRSIRELWEEVKLNSMVKEGNGNKTRLWK